MFVVLLLLLGLLAAPAAARPGDLDTTFGQGGVFVGTGDSNLQYIGDLVRQPDGSFLAVGAGRRFGSYGGVLVKLQPNGEFDRSFGWDGYAPLGVDSAAALLRRPDGRIVVAGTDRVGVNQLETFAVERYLPDGVPDESFGDGGRVRARVGTDDPPLPARDYMQTAALDPRGRMVLAGHSYGGEGSFAVLVRLLADGARDPSFGQDGVVRDRVVTASSSSISDLWIYPDGDLLAAGSRRRGGAVQPALVRYLEDGRRDPGFGRDGFVGAKAAEYTSFDRIEVLRGRRIVAMANEYFDPTWLLRRYSAAGRPDAGFGTHGETRVTLARRGRQWTSDTRDLLRQSDGKLLALSTVSQCIDRAPCSTRVVLGRFLQSGHLDREFGKQGLVRRHLTNPVETIYGKSFNDRAAVVRLLPEGRFVVGGSSGNGYMLARFSDSVAPRPVAPPRKVVVDEDGRGLAATGCRGRDPTCHGRLTLRASRLRGKRRVSFVAAASAFEASPGSAETVAFQLRRRARTLLPERGRLRVRASVRVRDDAGNSLTVERRMVLKRARASGAAAPPAPPRFFGMHADQAFAQDGEERLATLHAVRASGAGLVRQQLSWASVEREPGVYDFSEFDRYVEAVARADLDLLPILIEPPLFHSTAPAEGGRGFYPPSDPAAFRRFAAAAVRRYGPGGSFWNEHLEVPRRPIRSWQVWNEPSLAYFWRPRPDARRFGRLLRAVARAIHAADRRARVVSPALPESRYGVPLRRYLTRMERTAGHHSYDVLAVNPYARTVGGMRTLLRQTRRWLGTHGRHRTRIWVTEFGWASLGEREDQEQARRVAESVRLLARERRRLKLVGAIHYSWQDADPFPGGADFWGIRTGLFDRGGRPKPAWPAFRDAVRQATR